MYQDLYYDQKDQKMSSCFLALPSWFLTLPVNTLEAQQPCSRSLLVLASWDLCGPLASLTYYLFF